MSTATSALRSTDPIAAPEPVLRRRRSARAPRPFALVRSAMSRTAGIERQAVEASSAAPIAGSASPRRVATAPASVARSIVRSGVLSPPANGLPAAEPADIVRVPRRIDLTDAELDLAFATVPRSAPVRRSREVVRPPAADRGPRHRAPHSDLSLYARGPVRTGHARGIHPLHRVEQAKAGFAALAVTALVTALIVVAFLGLAHVRAGSFADHVDSTTPGISEQAGFGSGARSEPGR
ncbi:hypothetical protein ACFTS5_01645 [Nocardia sp. NPDC056952]|uniref:hypothetical protein n=1 Tax=Nocardia sp. NPDC056952 TaxID=3345979 RepID=UPI00362F6619